MNNKTVKVIHGNTGNLDYLKRLYGHVMIKSIPTQPVNKNTITLNPEKAI